MDTARWQRPRAEHRAGKKNNTSSNGCHYIMSTVNVGLLLCHYGPKSTLW